MFLRNSGFCFKIERIRAGVDTTISNSSRNMFPVISSFNEKLTDWIKGILNVNFSTKLWIWCDNSFVGAIIRAAGPLNLLDLEDDED